MSRFFTSDFHIRHDLVVRERGFGLPDGSVDHDAYEALLAENWDSRVRKDDIVYVLGDIAMNPAKGAFDWFDARPGRKVLVSGNHDIVHPMHSKAMQSLPKWLPHFESIWSSLSVKIGGQKILLSHFPYQGEGGRDIEDRHTQWRLRDEGMPLIHAHTHSTVVHETSHSFHAGLDAHGLELVHELEISDWLDSKSSSFFQN